MNVTGGFFGLFALIPILIYLGLVVFSIYFTVKVIKFMNAKTKLDQERNEKLGELIRVIGDRNKEEL
ncbi:hypothetical protein [Peribacillus loiseleuriae]|uniref:Uncharacterized protein n=1 Tax=Peribacillus loiseleuriae TaxID=1679170 RepID=A0A0K9GWC4_9BACI|nr:hypothetical protein [Peribacillus loiseleuriae]KMY50552.1 hypothetical protein AC625_14415 [Peribacillus loiseleuriae]